MAKVQSVEPNIADLANGWLKSYRLPYKLEQESLNTEIDQALNDYASKSGGAGGNRPDAKLLLQDKNLSSQFRRTAMFIERIINPLTSQFYLTPTP